MKYIRKLGEKLREVLNQYGEYLKKNKEKIEKNKRKESKLLLNQKKKKLQRKASYQEKNQFKFQLSKEIDDASDTRKTPKMRVMQHSASSNLGGSDKKSQSKPNLSKSKSSVEKIFFGSNVQSRECSSKSESISSSEREGTATRVISVNRLSTEGPSVTRSANDIPEMSLKIFKDTSSF